MLVALHLLLLLLGLSPRISQTSWSGKHWNVEYRYIASRYRIQAYVNHHSVLLMCRTTKMRSINTQSEIID